MKQHLKKIHHHVNIIHEHIKKHTKNAHEHVKKHGKWYIYGHILAASAIFSLMLNYNSNSSAANIDAPMCTETYNSSSIVLDYIYTDPKKDIILKWINFDNVVFPQLVLVKNVKQLKPTPNKNELSTDRWDLAWYTNPNKENPNEKEIAEYLSNNNLNNIIDWEWRVEVSLDIEFDQILSDNNSTGDAVGEIMIFERGMNSDIYIQAVDKLWGKGLGNKVFLNRKEMIYAWFNIDTIEIWWSQKMGYWRVDLWRLGVSELKYVRLSSLPVNSGPDFKIIWLNTQKCQQKQLKPLDVSVLCSASLTNTRFWKVINPNDKDVEITRDIYRSTQTWSQTILANSESIIQANTIEWPTVLRLYKGWEIQHIVPSSEEKCPVIQPEIPLELEPICSSDPENYRVWNVSNNNLQDLEFSWEIKNTWSCNGNKVLVCQVPPGNPENEHEICIAQQAVSSHLAKWSYLWTCTNSKKQWTIIILSWSKVTFTTPVIDDSQILAISVDGVEHDTANTILTSCPKQPSNDYTLSVVVDKAEILPYQELTYIIEYKNNWPEILESGSIDIVVDDNFVYIPNEEVETIEINHYRFLLPTMAADSSSILEIKGFIREGTNSGSLIWFKATILWERDVNIDNNTIIVNTLVKGLEPLELSSLCSDNPSAVRAWRIQNPNEIDVPVDIYVQDEFSASVIAKSKELTYVKTNTVEGTNIVSLRYNWQKQMEQSSENVACPKPISDLAVENIDIEMVSEDVFVATLTFINLGPNVSNEILIDVGWDDASFVVENTLQPQVQQTLQQMAIDESFVLSVTWALASWEAQVAVSIDWQTIDPNVYNNNSQTTVSRSDYWLLVEEDIVDEDNQEEHLAADEPENIQWYEVWEQIDIDTYTENIEENIEDDTYMEDVIWVWCSYTDEDYEKIRFQDVINHRSKPYVELLRINCIVKWRETNTFVTDDYINRAEAIKVAIKLWWINNNWKVKSDKYIYLGDTPMDDVDNANWAAQYVDKAYQIGLLDSLYKGTSFKKLFPNQNITRGESVELLVKTYLLLQKTSLEETEIDISAIFEDITTKSYAPYITYAYEKWFLQGVIDWEKTKFLPDQPISRSEFAKIAALVFKDFLPVYRIK